MEPNASTSGARAQWQLGACLLTGALGLVVPIFADQFKFICALILLTLVSLVRYRGSLSWRTFLPGTVFCLTAICIVVIQPFERLYMHQLVQGLPEGNVTLDQLQHDLRIRGIVVQYSTDERERIVTLPDGPVRLSRLVASIEQQTQIIHRPGVVCGTGIPMVWSPSRLNTHDDSRGQ